LIYASGQPGFEYHGDPEKTAAAMRGDFYTPGDLGHLDEDGWLYMSDRRTDLIISGGVNIYPAEIENALLQHPAVGDVVVIGVPDEDWGQIVVEIGRASCRGRAQECGDGIRDVHVTGVQTCALPIYTPGDLGHLDEDGWLYMSDRRTDLIISGGVNIYPAEIENALLQHPAVGDVVVIGVPDEDWGQIVV